MEANTSENESEIDLSEVMHAWGRAPGSGDQTTKIIASIGVVVTLLLLAMTMDLFCLYRHGYKVTGAVQFSYQLPTFALFFAMLWLARRGKSELAVSLRVACWIPLLHLLLVAGMVAIWLEVSKNEPYLVRHLTQLDQLAIEGKALLGALALLVALALYGIKTEGRRQPQWLQALAISLLLYTLFLGLWMPLAPSFDIPFLRRAYPGAPPLELRPEFVWMVVLPPAYLVLAVLIFLNLPKTQSVLRHPGLKSGLLIVGGLALAVAVVTRATADSHALLAYGNFVPVLVCAALLSMLAIAAIALAHWQALRSVRKKHRPAPWTQEGVVVCLPGEDTPARIRYDGWLRGLQPQCSRFVLRTKEGDLLIPAGSRLLAPIPLWTTRALPGEQERVLKAGDRVTATGFIAAPTDGPFRASPLPIAGSQGIVVVKQELRELSMWRDLALVVWRPAILYIAVVATIALPGLAGFFAF